MICFAIASAARVPAQDGVKTAAEAAARVRSMYFARDFEDAFENGKKLAATFPDSLELQAWLVLSMVRLHMRNEASEAIDKMIAKDAANAWTQFAMAIKQGDSALAASEKVMAAMPDNPDAIWLRADTLIRHDMREEAIAFIDASRAKVKNAAELLAYKAQLLYLIAFKAKNEAGMEEAFKVFEEARAIDPSNVNAYYLHASYLESAKRFDEAYRLMKRP